MAADGGAPRGAIVLAADEKALGIVRSLGRRGIRVLVLRDGSELAATASRHAWRRASWRVGSADERVDALLELARRRGLEDFALFPTKDETLALVASHADRLSTCFRLTTPPWPVLRLAHDKREMHRTAAAAGVPSPATWVPASRSELAALPCRFPVVVKPAFKEHPTSLTHARAWRADDLGRLVDRYDEAQAVSPPGSVLVQELLPGAGAEQYSYAALCLEGRPVASLVAHRLRQYPLEFGHSSSYVETTTEPEVERLGARLLEAMRFTGLAEVELKRDLRDGTLRVLDVNPRVWTWHPLGARAGVDFPFLLWRALSGDEPGRVRARTGVRWMRMLTDVPAAGRLLARGQLGPLAYLRSFRGPLEFSLFARDDPLPAVAEPAAIALRVARRRLTRPVHRSGT